MNIEQAITTLWDDALQGRFFPESLRGNLTLDEALQVQLGVLEKKKTLGERHAGWKVGLTSANVRKKFGSEERPFGHVMEHRVFDAGAEIPAERIVSCGVEAELCFTIGKTVQGTSFTPEQMRDVVSTVGAGFEINEHRAGGFADFPLSVADNLSQWGIVVGPGVTPPPPDFDWGEVVMEMRCDGQVVATALAREVIDNHYLSLSLLANRLGSYNLPLEEGHRVITGAYSKHSVLPGQRYEASFTGIGTVSATFIG